MNNQLPNVIENLNRSRALQHIVPVNHLLSHALIEPGDVVVDATVGNGADTQFLCECVGELGTVYGFDIQSEAIESTRVRLAKAKIEAKVHLIHAGHEHLSEYVKEPLKAVFFNLGYLPGGDKNQQTHWKTTKCALEASMALLVPGGFISVAAYPGTEQGFDEANALEHYLMQCSPQNVNVSKYAMINQVNHPPILYFIQKRSV